MNSKWLKLIFLPIAIALFVALWLAVSPYVRSEDVATAANVPITISPSLAAQLTPDAQLPGRVYVLNNREIVVEMPSMQAQGTPNAAGFNSDPQEVSYIIKVSVTVLPSRLIVVDENDTIVQIWSNTNGEKWEFYSLNTKEKHWQGQAHPLSPAILEQYNPI